MSTNNRNRERVDGHPGIYRRGDRFQARHRDSQTRKVVSRSFHTLEEAIAYKAALANGMSELEAYAAADQPHPGDVQDFDSLADAMRHYMIVSWKQAKIEDLSDMAELVSDWVSEVASAIDSLDKRIEELEARR
jgi:hypothetical protein